MADYQSSHTGQTIDERVTLAATNQADIAALKLRMSSAETSINNKADISTMNSALAGKQDKLASGTNIKTVGGQSILGSGNIPVNDDNAVKFVAQSLTDAHKAQARTNIDAASTEEVSQLRQELTDEQTFVGATGSYAVHYMMYAGKTYVITNNTTVNASVRSFDKALNLTDEFNFYLGGGLSREVTPSVDVYGFAGYVGAESNFTVGLTDSIPQRISTNTESIAALDTKIGIAKEITLSSTSAVGSWGKTMALNSGDTYVFKNASNGKTSLILYDAGGAELYRNNNFLQGATLEVTPVNDVAQVRGYSSEITDLDIKIQTKDSVFSELSALEDDIDGLDDKIGILKIIQLYGSPYVGSWQEAYPLKKGVTYKIYNAADTSTSLILYNANNTEVYRNNNLARGTWTEITPGEDVAKVAGYTSASKFVDIRIVEKDSVNEAVSELKQGEDVLFCNPPSIYDALVANAKRGRTVNPSNIGSCFSFFHFSDIHGNTENLGRIEKIYNRYRQFVKDIYCTGDIVTNTYADTNILSGYPYILALVGNHDAWSASEISGVTERQDSMWWVVNQKSCYDKYLADVAKWGVTQPENAAQNGYCYYYKDYTEGDNTLRIISLDCMHYNVGGDLVDGVSMQNTWLEEVLADAKTQSIPVVIMVHYWPVWVNIGHPEVLHCAYSTTDYIASDYLPDISIKSVQSYIDNGGEFICWVVGHAHADVISVPRDYPNQMFIAVDCATNANSVGNSERVSGTKSQDAFNLIAFDTETKLVKVVRFGSDTTRQLTQKRRLLFRYADYTDANGVQHERGLELCE